MKTTSPEVDGEITVLPNGRVHLTPAQMQQLIDRRLGPLKEVPEHEWQIVIDVFTGRQIEMLTRWRPNTIGVEARGKVLEGWTDRELTKKGMPDGRSTPARIGIWRVDAKGVPLETHHFRNRHALLDPEREKLAWKARIRVADAEMELNAAKCALLDIYTKAT